MRRAAPYAFVALAWAAVAVAGIWITLSRPLDPAPYLAQAPSAMIVDRGGVPLHAFLNEADHWSFPVPLGAISPHLVHATLAAEDQRFYTHPGVDPLAIARAAWQNATKQRVVSGASTITMQLIKRGGVDSRSLRGKARQLVLAPRLERSLDKDALLEAYLNGLPYGMNLTGPEAAAHRYFGKTAAELTVPEAALLAALPKAPTALMPLANPARAQARRDFVLRRMEADGYLTPAEAAAAMAAPLGVRWHDLPNAAPHVAMRHRARANAEGRLALTLDAHLQGSVERTVARALPRHRPAITNAAALVVHVSSGEIRAWVGSADFFETPGGGQVDAVRARRSPGSTLKPLIYGVALDQSLLYPTEVLLDAPWREGRYHPENFDFGYRGRIGADEALRLSLNIPALTVLNRVGTDAFGAFAQEAGLDLFEDRPDTYGLGMALGSCEATLLGLAGAYRMIAALGEYRPLRLVPSDPPQTPMRRLERGTCLALFAMLEQPLPGAWDHRVGVSLDIRHRRVAWKTGTSPGNRDAWAFVFDAEYLVAVWMGNNDARPSPRLVGAQAALPLAAAIVRALPPPSPGAWPASADDLRPVTVAAASGLPATAWSTATRTALFPSHALLHRRCAVEVPDGAGGVRTRWPAGPQRWDLAQFGTATPPSAVTRAVTHLAVLEPAPGAEFVLVAEDGADRIQLRATATDRQPLHWFVNGRHIGQAPAGETLPWPLTPGSHEVTCITPDGSRASAVFRVAHPAEWARTGDRSQLRVQAR